MTLLKRVVSGRFVGRRCPSCSFISITALPIQTETWANRSFDIHSPSFDKFLIILKFRVLVWTICAKYTGSGGSHFLEWYSDNDWFWVRIVVLKAKSWLTVRDACLKWGFSFDSDAVPRITAVTNPFTDAGIADSWHPKSNFPSNSWNVVSSISLKEKTGSRELNPMSKKHCRSWRLRHNCLFF